MVIQNPRHQMKNRSLKCHKTAKGDQDMIANELDHLESIIRGQQQPSSEEKPRLTPRPTTTENKP